MQSSDGVTSVRRLSWQHVAPWSKILRMARIVVIEDHVDTADLMREILREAGHDVHVAHTGHDGVMAARTVVAEVVLCDVGLPDIDGYEVARRLRAEPLTAAVHLVALTGYDGDDERTKARAAGFDRHVVKPIDPAQLETLIKR